MTPPPVRVPEAERPAALDRLLTLCGAEDEGTLLGALDAARVTLDGATDPRWVAWSHTVAAHRCLTVDDTDGVAAEVAAARAALDPATRSAETALVLAYLAHTAARAEHVDAAMLLAVDAAVLTDAEPAPARTLALAHGWLSRALAELDLGSRAAAHTLRGRQTADGLPDVADRFRALLRCAQQHAELAEALSTTDRGRAAAGVATDAAGAARELDREPTPAELDLLDVVQAWAMGCGGEPEEALGPLRRVRRRAQADGGVWLRGYADLALARVLDRTGDRRRQEEAAGLLADAAGELAAAGDRRRYRQCLLALGRAAAELGRPAEAVHWLDAHRAEAGRARARTRERWAERFARSTGDGP